MYNNFVVVEIDIKLILLILKIFKKQVAWEENKEITV